MFSLTVRILRVSFTLKLSIAIKFVTRNSAHSSISGVGNADKYWDKWADRDNTLKFKRRI